jgi:hypothetical protein
MAERTDPEREEAIALYALPREDFTRARNERASQLKREGRHEAAAAVKALAKPDQVAAAINQAVRRKPKLRDELLSAGERLREASAGAEGAGLRRAMAAERAAVDRLVEVAGEYLGNARRLDDAALTLHAASTNEELRDRVRDGRLVTKAKSTQVLGISSRSEGSPPRRPRGQKALRRAREAERKALRAQRSAEKEARQAELAVEKAQRELRRLEDRHRSREAKAEKARAAAASATEQVRELSND